MIRINAWKTAVVLVAVAALFSLASVASADLITQSGAHLAFDAVSYNSIEDGDTDLDVWTESADAGTFSGGNLLEGPASNPGFATAESQAVYSLEFTTPSDFYRVFVRFQSVGQTGNSDSIYTTNWGGTDATTGRTLGGTAANNGDFFYKFIGGGTIAAGTLEFRMGVREPSARVDRIIFADATLANSGTVPGGDLALTTSGAMFLEAIANSPITVTAVPEPSAFAFGSLVVMLGVTTKLRRRIG